MCSFFYTLCYTDFMNIRCITGNVISLVLSLTLLKLCCCCCCCCVTSVVSNSVRPHRWQPTRLPYPRDSPGKNTGVGCHFLLQCMEVTSESEVAQSCLTLSDPMDCSPPGSSAHGFSRQGYWSGLPLPSPLRYSSNRNTSGYLGLPWWSGG